MPIPRPTPLPVQQPWQPYGFSFSVLSRVISQINELADFYWVPMLATRLARCSMPRAAHWVSVLGGLL
jgi:hypothetical protein